MLGLMQDWPLLCHRIIDHAAMHHADRLVVSRSIEGPLHETNYAAIRGRALKVAQRLEKDGITARRPGRDPGLEHLAAPGRPGTASSASARSITPSTRGCFPIRSAGSSIMRRTA